MLKVVHSSNKLFIAFCLAFFAAIGINGTAHAETATYQVNLNKSLRVTIPTGPVEISVNPSTRPFNGGVANVSVSTNNSAGYYMTMSTTDNTTSLYKSDDGSKILETLSEKSGGYTESNFETNKWGYKIGSANYIPFVSGVKIAESDTYVDNDTTELTFAAKVDFLQASGTYKTKLEFLAVANPSPMNIQDLDPAYCTETPLWVIDARDGEEYMIQRLADGNCWMLDNLRLDPTETLLTVLKGATNATDESLSYLKNGGGSGRYAGNALTKDRWYNTNDDPLYWYLPYYTPQVVTDYKDNVSTITHGVASNKYGVFYNFCAASAGSYCVEANAEEPEDLTEDICPAGWRMPTGGNGKMSETKKLYDTYYAATSNYYNVIADALSVPTTGYFNNYSSDLADTTSSSKIWTSTYSGQRFWKHMEFSVQSQGVYFRHDQSDTRSQLFQVRCVMKKNITSATYFQDVTPQMVKDTPTGTVAILKDKRDNEEYKVAKLKDGNIWMLDNLRLDPTAVSLETLQGNTNAADETLNYYKNGGGTDDDLYPVVGVLDPGEGSVTDYNKPIVVTQYKDTVVEGTPGVGSGKAGVLYNVCAVSAGSDCPRSGADIDLTQDICPASWRLPTGSTTGEYKVLSDVYASTDDRYQNAYNFVEALSLPRVYTYTGYSSPIGSQIALWTATHSGTSDLYTMEISVSTYNGRVEYFPYFYEDKMRPNRIAVRCIAKTD